MLGSSSFEPVLLLHTRSHTKTFCLFLEHQAGNLSNKICRAAVQKTGRCQWTYSFEAECLLFALPQPAHRDGEQLCEGIVGNFVPDVRPGQHSEHTPEDALVILEKIGCGMKTRPAFADLFSKVNDKLAFMKRVKPYMWVGIEGGLRSSFCTGMPMESSGTCTSCQQLQKIMGFSSGMSVESAT